MTRAQLTPEQVAAWPSCTVADCSNKACLGLSETLCFPHLFKLPMDDEGNAIFPDEETEAKYHRMLEQAWHMETIAKRISGMKQ